ncbi:hypothetical protein LC087_04410 [Bacillus carboniphilus]|uniref:Lipoprotein n=1 Tax=Bacillus carboniphilus TaxID=86663 RepID=A0ABY9JY32_9BACI|nr:hypothetical protein [Bacillus carboniphilus]WLR43423.1 hypothetical protein LC087_04410 [Bacillus carboniphilus]
MGKKIFLSFLFTLSFAFLVGCSNEKVEKTNRANEDNLQNQQSEIDSKEEQKENPTVSYNEFRDIYLNMEENLKLDNFHLIYGSKGGKPWI